MNHDQITAAQHGKLYLKSFTIEQGKLTLDSIALFLRALAVAPSYRNLILFHVGGGAISRVPSNQTAFPHRSAVVVLQVKAIWQRQEEEEANRRWVDNIADAIEGNVSGAYVNYIDARLMKWEHAYYGDNLPRLQAVKRRVDPSSLFVFNQSIPPADQ
jgi:FAD/FMN-containing dehydrogenase